MPTVSHNRIELRVDDYPSPGDVVIKNDVRSHSWENASNSFCADFCRPSQGAAGADPPFCWQQDNLKEATDSALEQSAYPTLIAVQQRHFLWFGDFGRNGQIQGQRGRCLSNTLPADLLVLVG